jgi:hypothetical protein
VGVDNRLVEYWRRQLAGRRLRLVPSVRSSAETGREAGHGVDSEVEPAAGGRRSNVVPMTFEDR